MILGITGSSGAGKSTVCEILEKDYHAKVINADKIAKKLSKKGTEYLSKIAQNFGTDILLENGELNRKKLADIIYQDSKKRELLNQCTFKYIKKEIENELKNAQEDVIAIDAPLLFEAKLEEFCNCTIAVIAKKKEVQLQRIIKRDGIEEEHAKKRIAAQPNNEYYISKCDYKITNDNNLEDVEEQLQKIIKKVLIL